MPESPPAPVRIRTVTHDMIRYTLDSFYSRASTYAARVAGLGLSENEARALLDQHRQAELERVLAALEQSLGGWTIIRDATEGACP